jgi:hypothetical protein
MSDTAVGTTNKVENLNVSAQEILITPDQLKTALPMSAQARATITQSRQVIRNILDRKDHRLFVVVGPCSIHDIDAAHDYARRLKKLADEIQDTIFIVMRVYFEKPRTTVGWKGLINDPYMNDTFKIEEGLHIGRKLLLDISEMGLATSTEALDPISPQYLQDCITWSAIGARTTESQTHREMASGLSSAVDQCIKIGIAAAPFSRHQFAGPGRGYSYHRQCVCARRVARRQQRPELRFSAYRAVRTGIGQGENHSEHHGRLQPCQFEQSAGAATAGDGKRYQPSARRQQIDCRPDGGKQFIPRQSIDPGRFEQTAIRRLGHRRLYRLG